MEIYSFYLFDLLFISSVITTKLHWLTTKNEVIVKKLFFSYWLPSWVFLISKNFICIYTHTHTGNWLKNFSLWKFQEKSRRVADIRNWVFQEHTKRFLFSPLQTLESSLGFVTIDSPIKYWLYYWKGEFM